MCVDDSGEETMTDSGSRETLHAAAIYNVKIDENKTEQNMSDFPFNEVHNGATSQQNRHL